MMFSKSILLFCIEKWGMRISKNSFRKKFAFLCIILKNEVFEVNSFVLYWKMRIYKNSFLKKIPSFMYYIEKWCFRSQFFCFVLKNEKWGFLKTLSEKNLHSYVLYWNIMFSKSILLFCIEKWGMRISKNSFRKHFAFLCIKIEKWGFLKSILLFFIEKWEFLKTLFRKMLYSYVLYWKIMFLKSNLMFCIEKWGMRISKNTFRKKFAFLCIILKYDVFEVNSFFFCIEKWGMRISKNSFRKKFAFLCIILKN